MPRPDAENRIAAAAFRILAKVPWSETTLASVARAAKVPLDEVLRIAPSRAALIAVMLRRAAADTAKHYRPDRATQNPRERLFDAIMCWFETQNTRKDAIRALYNALKREPLTLLSLHREFVASAEWLLVLAETDAGAASSVRAACIGGIVAHALPVWLSDDDDTGRTMAQLDRDLRRVERFLWPTKRPKQTTRRRPRAR